jgi:DNA-binding response OmpR family regulator
MTTPKLTLDLPRLDVDQPANILVVDDDADIRGLVELTLTNAGYSVTTAAHGSAALAAIDRRLPDLVVLDVAMPGMSGIDVCTELRTADRTRLLPIIMLTARRHVMFESQGMMAGADLYMVKPFSPKALVSRVENLLTYSR